MISLSSTLLHRAGVWAPLGLFLCLAGCGSSGPTLYNIKGSVSLDGQPVPAGRIEFEPDTAQGNSGGMGFARIVNGTYDTSAPGGRGVLGGPHRVRITGYDGQTASQDESTPLTIEAKPLFVGYTVNEELPSEEGATKDFPLPASAKGYDSFKSGNADPRAGGV